MFSFCLGSIACVASSTCKRAPLRSLGCSIEPGRVDVDVCHKPVRHGICMLLFSNPYAGRSIPARSPCMPLVRDPKGTCCNVHAQGPYTGPIGVQPGYLSTSLLPAAEGSHEGSQASVVHVGQVSVIITILVPRAFAALCKWSMMASAAPRCWPHLKSPQPVVHPHVSSGWRSSPHTRGRAVHGHGDTAPPTHRCRYPTTTWDYRMENHSEAHEATRTTVNEGTHETTAV